MGFRAWGRAALRSVALGLALASAVLVGSRAQGQGPPLPIIHVDNGPNSPEAQKAHYVVLVSLDGFRWDYAKKMGARHLLAGDARHHELGQRGEEAAGHPLEDARTDQHVAEVRELRSGEDFSAS